MSNKQVHLSQRMRELDGEMGRRGVHTLGLCVTDMRHFNLQYKEVTRFIHNLERTNEYLKAAVSLAEQLASMLPDEHSIGSLADFVASSKAESAEKATEEGNATQQEQQQQTTQQ
eukprot:TRINITY_DN5388_c0_g1_i2.p2 TRINITY_DN5388_c0_g1~~TRINITY_DN5388_c0_g1_i2.p2  ORF type:complete len:115 (-),score=21.30 TRINITY_DN5388_c0_g1_i2:120-464(-)